MFPAHYRPAHAASRAGGHFYETMLYPAAANILKRGNNVVQPVYRIIIVERVFVCHCVKYTAACGEKPCAAFFVVIAHAFKHNAFFGEHCGYFFECECGVHANARGFVLL